MKMEDVLFMVELGCMSDIFEQFFLTKNKAFHFKEYGVVERLTPKQFKKQVGLSISEVRNAFKSDVTFIKNNEGRYFVEVGEDYIDEDDGVYIETDHLQLVEDGVFPEVWEEI